MGAMRATCEVGVDLISRGEDPVFAQRLVAEILNLRMVAKIQKGENEIVKPLEWQEFRCSVSPQLFGRRGSGNQPWQIGNLPLEDHLVTDVRCPKALPIVDGLVLKFRPLFKYLGRKASLQER